MRHIELKDFVKGIQRHPLWNKATEIKMLDLELLNGKNNAAHIGFEFMTENIWIYKGFKLKTRTYLTDEIIVSEYGIDSTEEDEPWIMEYPARDTIVFDGKEWTTIAEFQPEEPQHIIILNAIAQLNQDLPDGEIDLESKFPDFIRRQENMHNKIKELNKERKQHEIYSNRR